MITLQETLNYLEENLSDKSKTLVHVWAVHDTLAEFASEDNEDEYQMHVSRATMLYLQDVAYKLEEQ